MFGLLECRGKSRQQKTGEAVHSVTRKGWWLKPKGRGTVPELTGLESNRN